MGRLVGAGVVLLAIAALLFLAWQAANALLVLFAGVLFAVFLDALVRPLGRIVPGPRGVRLALVSTVLFLLFAATLVWGGTVIAQQADELGTTLTEQTQRALHWLRERGVPVPELDTNKAVGSAPTGDGSILSPAGIFRQAQSAVGAVFAAFGNLFVIVILGLFIAAQPNLYRDGLIRLSPQNARARVSALLDEMGEGLRYWILGQAFVMLVVAVTTAGGLALLGISPALILGVQAGLLAFIPNIGPVIAGVPIILAGLAQGIIPALGALGIYLLIQALESYLLTPLVQRRAIDVPPAIIFGGQVVLGVLFGLFGLALAVPLIAVAKVAIDKLYIEGILEEKGD